MVTQRKPRAFIQNTHNKPKKRIHDPFGDKVAYAVIGLLLMLVTIIIAYPLIYVLSSSFSSPADVAAGRVVLWPVNLSLDGYKAVFAYPAILTSYANTLFYTVAGTLINIAVTLACAYPLTRKDFPFRRFFMFLFTFTMFFSGGLIPLYILVVQLQMINTVWAMLIPGAMSVFNMIMVRTYIMSSIPGQLLESAQIDGCSDAQYFFRILLPLSKPVIAVITLFYAVGHWNTYFNAMIFLSDPNLYPLQIVLRNILIANQVDSSMIKDADTVISMVGLSDLLKHSLIVVSAAPILIVYPFVQKYFVNGVMLGSIKE